MARRTNTAVWRDEYNHWRINVQKDGDRRSFYSSVPGRKGQREANAKADAWLDDGISGDSRISAIYPMFLESVTSPGERKKADSLGRCYILPAVGRRRISDVSEDDLQDIIDKAALSGCKSRPLSKKYLGNLRATIRSFYKYCRRKKLTQETLEFLQIPATAEAGEKHILQPKDLITLFAVGTTQYRGKIIQDKYIHAYRFAVLTGVRPGELAGLERGDIHGNMVRLQRSINIDGVVTAGKNANARRQFALTALSYTELQQQLEGTTGERVFGIDSQKSYRKWWRRYCVANNIPYISPYEMRHTFVSLVKSLPEGEVKALVGHSKSMDTWGVYGHAADGEQERIAKKLQAIFSDLLSDKAQEEK